MKIRLANFKDNIGITQCIKNAFGVYIERLGRKPGPMLADYKPNIENNGVYVLDQAGNITGVLVLKVHKDHLYIDAISVTRRYQGKGFGRELVKFAETLAIEMGLPELRLCTNVHMHEIQRFYLKLGFNEIERKFADGYDRIYYCKIMMNAGPSFLAERKDHALC